MEPKEKTTATAVWLVLNRASRSVQAFAEKSIAELGIGLTDFGILEMLLHKGAMSMSMMAEKSLLANASMTSAIDRLEERGLVERTYPANDRRVRLVQLTREGTRMARQLFNQHQEDMERVMEDLSAPERAQLRRLLKKLGLAAKSLA
ncbi:MAG: MarR family transcriptional regulator [Acidobacteria bacterium]|nr:MarR family transcriptional regulator [Acidobacteriota bacterium]